MGVYLCAKTRRGSNVRAQSHLTNGLEGIVAHHARLEGVAVVCLLPRGIGIVKVPELLPAVSVQPSSEH